MLEVIQENGTTYLYGADTEEGKTEIVNKILDDFLWGNKTANVIIDGYIVEINVTEYLDDLFAIIEQTESKEVIQELKETYNYKG
jgi:uncharacterized protein YacL